MYIPERKKPRLLELEAVGTYTNDVLLPFIIKPIRATFILMTLLSGYIAAYFLYFISNIQIKL